MTSAGEKQYYVVALMDSFIAHLPLSWTIGFMYDIACQIHASAVKHNIFEGYLHRLRFAVSVFHAYGHDWPCQLVYHPRKRVGFGLTDGEGCERFWYSISRLIPYLRVAGFHLRQYTLNSQFDHATAVSLENAASWLARKRALVSAKRREARGELEACGAVGKRHTFLREQWSAQIAHQTQEAPRQSRTRGRTEVELAIDLRLSVDDARKGMERAKSRRSPGNLESRAEVDAATATHKLAVKKYNRKVRQLGVDSSTQLNTLLHNKTLLCRANALALLRRAQTAILRRKLELERVSHLQGSKNGGQSSARLATRTY
ncbi:hypothetical protein BD626DRAFT_404628 [Schizophyllum amplum]|uniref:Uncharacterized protein n=1 Tax=Schizophyllum amplum TaxID=97359 RepID=A0A550CBB3_9AGAR|nr:hypothetical protein BD626DRAFT_404628 [Auriculariopsis ampla]